MSIDDSLAALSAGLDRDEQLARAAAERSPDWTAFDGAVVGGDVTPAEPEYGFSNTGEYTIVYDEGYPLKAEALHIAEQDPARTLRQVEAIRKVIADVRDPNAFEAYASANIDHTSFMEGVEAAAELFVRALAGIYTDEVEETP